jgi:hypothetical protein
MFEAAQATVNQYMENVYLICDRKKKAAEHEAFHIVEQARAEAMGLPTSYYRKGDGSNEGPEQE